MAQNFTAGNIFLAFKSATNDLFAGFKKARQALKSMADRAKDVASKLANAGRKMARALGTPLGAVANLTKSLTQLRTLVVAFLASQTFRFLVTGPAEAAAQMREQAEATGLATESLGAYLFAVERLGGRQEAFTQALQSINEKLFGARFGLQESVMLFEEAGIEVQKANGEFKNAAEILLELGEKGDVSADTLQKLGPNVAQLSVVFSQGSEAIREATKRAVAFGAATDGTMVRLGEQLRRMKTDLKGAFGLLAEQVTKTLLPLVLKVGDQLAGFIADNSAKIQAFALVVQEVMGQIGENLSGRGEGGLAEGFQAFGVFLIDFLSETLSALAGFLRENIGRIMSNTLVLVAGILGPGALKLMALLGSKVKEGLTQILNLIQFPFVLAKELVIEFVTVAQARLSKGVADTLRTTVDFFANSRLGQLLIPDSAVEKAHEFLDLIENGGKEADKNIRGVGKILDENIAKLQATSVEIEKAGKAERDRLEAEIDEMVDALKEQGQIGAAIADSANLFKEGFGVVTDTLKESLRETAGEFGVDVDSVIGLFEEKLRDVRAEQEAAIARIEAGGGGDGGGEGQGTELTPEQQAKIAAQGEQLRITISGSVSAGVVDGISRGASSMEILADIGRRLMSKALTDAIDSFTVAMSESLKALGVEASGLVNGILNAAIALVGFLLSQLEKGSDASSRFGKVGAEVESSQLVRGVVSGPTSVAIAELQGNLDRAMVPVVERLDILTGIGQEILSRMSGGGGRGAGTAGATPTI
jgi:hypothetical protein